MSRPCNRSQITPWLGQFQSRAGFSECLDLDRHHCRAGHRKFQSRAGFSECLDFLDHGYWHTPIDCFNPVLGFLSVSTSMTVLTVDKQVGFNPVLGFLSVSTSSGLTLTCGRLRFNPVLGFLSVSTGGEYTVIGVKSLSQCSKSNPRYVDWGCTET